VCAVIACDKREAFAQGSICDEAIHLAAQRKEAGLLRFARNDGIAASPLRGDEVRLQNASSDTIMATSQMTAAQSADQIVVVNKRTGRNESKLRVFARRPGWTLANANAFHVA
jgi:hypothetical protein